MKKTEKLSRWLLILIVFEVLLLLYCLFFARGILLEEGLFFVLGLFSAIVLSDLLLTWTILLSFAFGIVFLVAGVVYKKETEEVEPVSQIATITPIKRNKSNSALKFNLNFNKKAKSHTKKSAKKKGHK